jgi:hypothetical protein
MMEEVREVEKEVEGIVKIWNERWKDEKLMSEIRKED